MTKKELIEEMKDFPINSDIKDIIDNWSYLLRDIIKHAAIFHKDKAHFDYLLSTLKESYFDGQNDRR